MVPCVHSTKCMRMLILFILFAGKGNWLDSRASSCLISKWTRDVRYHHVCSSTNNLKKNEAQSTRAESTHKGVNGRSSEIQATALVKCLRAWNCIYRSMPAGVAQSRPAFVGGTVCTWGRWWIPVNKRQKRHQIFRSISHCSWGTCRSDSGFPQLVV